MYIIQIELIFISKLLIPDIDYFAYNSKNLMLLKSEKQMLIKHKYVDYYENENKNQIY